MSTTRGGPGLSGINRDGGERLQSACAAGPLPDAPPARR